MNIIPILLLGGSGTRLWPVSRKNHPKQFLNLTGDNTLLQATLSRLEGLQGIDPPIIICNEEHRFTTAEQLTEMGKPLGDIILEPVGKNTAPAVTIAAHRALQRNEDALLLILPTDHVIRDEQALRDAITIASTAANDNYLVTFGVVPSGPETGYGYIKRSKAIDDKFFTIDRFVEKPDTHTAKSYLESGEYYWNSGMFLFKASLILNELEKHHPEISHACKEALDHSQEDLDFIRLDKEAFMSCPADSIDYAIMEQTTRGATVPLDAGWSDIGAWDALWQIEEKDDSGNVLRGDVVSHDSSDNLVIAEHKLVSLVGVKDMVVIETKDAVLVADRTKAQDVKTIVEGLRQNQRSEAELHREVYRPWGKYDGIDLGDRFQVKRITVKPGESTSLQMHHHRAEHWIIVSGMAEITCDGKTFLCPENQSTFIPQGSTHRIANPGKLPMEMIEVQTGSYLGEDDIVRYDDYYGRSDAEEGKQQ